MSNLYTKYKHPMELVPMRIRLFFYFSIMAWVSLFNPEEGKDLTDCANEGANERQRKVFQESMAKWSNRKC